MAKTGGGVLALSGVNTYSGGTTIGNNTTTPGAVDVVAITNNSALGTGNVAFDRGTVRADAANLSIANAATLTANGGTFDNNGNNLTWSGVISNAAGNAGTLTKVGGGTLTLSGTNTYSGGTTIGNNNTAPGVVDVVAITNNSAFGSGNVAFNRGTIRADADNMTVANAATLTANGGTFDTNTNYLGWAGVIANASGNVGTLTKVGSGRLGLSGANTYTGATTINGGMLALVGNGSIAASSVVSNNSAFSIAGMSSFSTTIATYNATGTTELGGNNLTITNGGAVSGVISDRLRAGVLGSITLSGGTLTLSGANTYAGGTNINGGTLNFGTTANQTNVIGAVANVANLNFVNADASGMTTLSNTGASALTTVQGATSAGTATVTNTGTGLGTTTAITFSDNATAGAATITSTRSATVNFTGNSTAGRASLVNSMMGATGAFLNFSGNASAGTATITNNQFGFTSFLGSSTADNATIINNAGGATDISGHSGPIAIGSLSGAGSVGLGRNALTLGGLNGNDIISGTISDQNNVLGAGSIIKIGTETLTLSGTNTYDGLTTVSGGTLALTTTGRVGGGVLNNATFTSAGTVAGGLTNTGTVNANGGTINGAISNNAGTFNVGGTVTSNSTFNNINNATLAVGGAGNYTLGGLLTNSGALTVAAGGQLTATAGGITNASTGSIVNNGTIRDDLNNAGPLVNNANYFATVATNTGSITNSASGVWTGNVLSNAGLIVNNGTWTGNIASGAGGTLTGSGSVANLTITGGTFAPGNGTPGSAMTVAGSLTFAAATAYLVQVNPTTASTTNVTGTASLGGASVNASYTNGSYIARRYTILTANGGRNGTFGALTNTNLPANITTSLSYDANNAYLDLALGFIAPGGLNQNQQNVANALNTSFVTNGGISAAFARLSPAGLTQASGEVGTGTQQATVMAMDLFLGLVTDPFVAGRAGSVGAGGGAPLGYAADESDEALGYAAKRKPADAFAAYMKAPPRVTEVARRWSVWSAGFGGAQTTDGNVAVGSNTATSRIYGGAVGLDYLMTPNTLAGFALAGGGTNFAVANGGTGRSDLFQAAGYLRHAIGASYLSATLAYGWQDVTTERTVGADRLTGRFTSDTFAGRIESGHRFVAPIFGTGVGGLGITPYAAAQFTSIRLPTYSETAGAGAGTFGLTFAGRDVTASRSELGVRTDQSFAVQDGIFTLRSRAAWAHNFNPDRSIQATFQTLPGASFVVNGTAQARDAALVTGSAEMKWRSGWAIAGTFEGEFSNVTRSYAGKGIVRYAW